MAFVLKGLSADLGGGEPLDLREFFRDVVGWNAAADWCREQIAIVGHLSNEANDSRVRWREFGTPETEAGYVELLSEYRKLSDWLYEILAAYDWEYFESESANPNALKLAPVVVGLIVFGVSITVGGILGTIYIKGQEETLRLQVLGREQCILEKGIEHCGQVEVSEPGSLLGDLGPLVAGVGVLVLGIALWKFTSSK